MEFAIKIFIAVNIKLRENFYGSFHLFYISRKTSGGEGLLQLHHHVVNAPGSDEFILNGFGNRFSSGMHVEFVVDLFDVESYRVNADL